MLAERRKESRSYLLVLSIQQVAIMILGQGMKLRSKSIEGERMRTIGMARESSVLLMV